HAARPFRKLRLALDHFGWRGPYRPFSLHGDAGRAGPAKAFAPHADAVAHGLAILHDEVEELLLGIDNDGAGLLSGLVGDDLPPEFAWHLFDRDARQLIARI